MRIGFAWLLDEMREVIALFDKPNNKGTGLWGHLGHFTECRQLSERVIELFCGSARVLLQTQHYAYQIQI